MRESQHGAVTLRFARTEEARLAPDDVAGWGYRELDPGEAVESTWVAVERDGRLLGWWWLHWATPTDALLHVCIAPGESVWTRRVLDGFGWVAELFGAKQLLVVPPDEGPVKGYMRRLGRLGWTEREGGVFTFATRRQA